MSVSRVTLARVFTCVFHRKMKAQISKKVFLIVLYVYEMFVGFTLPVIRIFLIKIEQWCFNKFGWLLNLLHFIDNSFLLVINWKPSETNIYLSYSWHTSRFIQMVLHFVALIVALENCFTGLGSYVLEFLHTFKYGFHNFSEIEQ